MINNDNPSAVCAHRIHPFLAKLSDPPLPIPVGMIPRFFFSWCFFCSYYNTKSVLLCLGITALVCLSVTIFSFQSKVGLWEGALEGSGNRINPRDVGMSPEGSDQDVVGRDVARM